MLRQNPAREVHLLESQAHLRKVPPRQLLGVHGRDVLRGAPPEARVAPGVQGGSPDGADQAVSTEVLEVDVGREAPGCLRESYVPGTSL